MCTLGLLECFQDDPWRADFEKQAFASCQHPFIVNLDYAFQTDSLAIMVLGLATAGDLQKVRCTCLCCVILLYLCVLCICVFESPPGRRLLCGGGSAHTLAFKLSAYCMK
jgi:hypothetical protein